jgi:lipopolysaccharide assembly protein B
MNFEIWWLLVLPLFFGLGWFASRLDRKSDQQPSKGQLPEAYFKGLNFLLNEQPDKAIDAFVDVVRLDPETVELHFALGNLFRRRGEYDRAIRVHQNLFDRAGIKPDHKSHALYELGQDFLKAGLLDRSEDAFNRLAGSSFAGAALKHRLSIAQMVSDWPQAVELAEELQKLGGESHSKQLCHFRCEQADIEAAERAFPGHPRPALMRGDALFNQGRYTDAISAWRPLFKAHPEYLGLVAGRWLQAHLEINPQDRNALAELEGTLEAHFSSDVFRVIYEARVGQDGQAKADLWAQPLVQKSASLLALNQVIKSGPEEQSWLRSLVATHAEPKTRYTCKQCGFQAKQYFWRCPGCNQWDSYPPGRL